MRAIEDGVVFSKFSLPAYRAVLEIALSEGFKLRGFEEPGLSAGKSLIVRIDVDYSPEWAVELARINEGVGISGTFFIQPDSVNYNLFSWETFRAVAEINRLKQYVGLHFWETEWKNEKYTVERVLLTFRFLKEWFPFIRPVVCWHNPLKELLERPSILAGTGLMNAYAPEFFSEGCYYSDSNCRNHPEDFIRALKSKNDGHLAFLFHPINWVIGGSSVEEILSSAFRQKIEALHKGFCYNSVWASGLGLEIMKKLRCCL